MSEDTHRHHKERLAPYLLGALTPSELADFEHHLEGCGECQAELRWLDPAAGVLSSEVDQIAPPPGLRRSVMEAVAEDARRQPGESGLESEAQDVSGRTARSRTGSWFRMPSPAGRPSLAGAFALVFVVLVAGLGGYSLSSLGDDPSGTAVTAGTSTDGSEVVLVSDGESGTLRISGLERPAGGDVYQAWIQRGENIEPTDSLFLPRSDGTATAAIPDLEGASAVMVSAEPTGGSRSPTTTPIITVALES
jgi:hypothetical protein